MSSDGIFREVEVRPALSQNVRTVKEPEILTTSRILSTSMMIRTSSGRQLHDSSAEASNPVNSSQVLASAHCPRNPRQFLELKVVEIPWTFQRVTGLTMMKMRTKQLVYTLSPANLSPVGSEIWFGMTHTKFRTVIIGFHQSLLAATLYSLDIYN